MGEIGDGWTARRRTRRRKRTETEGGRILFTSAASRMRNVAIRADLLREKVPGPGVSGSGGATIFGHMTPARVVAAFAEQGAAGVGEVPNQLALLHGQTGTGSPEKSPDAALRASSRLNARAALRTSPSEVSSASWFFPRGLTPGTSLIPSIHLPASCWMRAAEVDGMRAETRAQHRGDKAGCAIRRAERLR